MDKDAIEQGNDIRRRMLGGPNTDAEVINPNAFNKPIQEIVSQGFGQIWTRPDMSMRDRSLVTLSMIIALNRPEQIQAHTKGALANGVTPIELREVILQAQLYCGLPVAASAGRAIAEVLKAAGVDFNNP